MYRSTAWILGTCAILMTLIILGYKPSDLFMWFHKPTIAEVKLKQQTDYYNTLTDKDSASAHCSFAAGAKKAAEEAEDVEAYQKWDKLSFRYCTQVYVDTLKTFYGKK